MSATESMCVVLLVRLCDDVPDSYIIRIGMLHSLFQHDKSVAVC